jgi:hypothetical protein
VELYDTLCCPFEQLCITADVVIRDSFCCCCCDIERSATIGLLAYTISFILLLLAAIILSSLHYYTEYGEEDSVAVYVPLVRNITSTTLRSRKLQLAFCHHILVKHVLHKTAYARLHNTVDNRAVGYDQAIAAMHSILAALALERAQRDRKLHTMMHAAAAPISGEQPGWTAAQMREVVDMSERLDKKLKDVVQSETQKCKELLTVMQAEARPYSVAKTQQQSTINFFKSSSSSGGASSGSSGSGSGSGSNAAAANGSAAAASSSAMDVVQQ